MLAKIRRMHFRDKLSLREIAKRSGLSRNTLRRWLRQQDVTEPVYPVRVSLSILDPYREQLEAWLRTDSHRPQRDRRTGANPVPAPAGPRLSRRLWPGGGVRAPLAH